MGTAIVLGAAGMLGGDVVTELTGRGWQAVPLDMADLDLTDPVQVARISSGEFGKPDWCVNCAAYTAVDRAEDERDAAYAVNALAPGYVAQTCRMAGIRMLHISTDFVFDGSAAEPYDENAQPNPLGVYGHTKLEGEEAAAGAVIARTAWLYGPRGACFPKTMARAWEAGKSLRVVADQQGNPTYTADLARVLVDLIDRDVPAGVYHTAGVDTMSWHRFAEVALQTLAEVKGIGRPVEIQPISTDDWPTPARRPHYSALSFAKCASLGIAPMRPTSEALREFWLRS
jgi:dTDP-4-dehydrorhamnose reductase